MTLKNYEFTVYWNPPVFSLLLLENWDGYNCELETSAFMQTCTHACLLRPYGMNQILHHSSKTVMHFPPFSVVCSWHDILYFEQPTVIVLCKWSLFCEINVLSRILGFNFVLGLLWLFQY